MKGIKLLPLGFLFLPFLVNAQIGQGSKFIGGSMSVYTTTTTPDGPYNTTHSYLDINFYPTIGFFISEKTALGLQLGYGNMTSEDKSDLGSNSDKSVGFSAGIFANRYFNLGERFWFSINGSISFRRQSNETTAGSNTIESSYNALNIGVRPEFTFFPNQHWGISGGIGRLSYTHSSEIDTENSQNLFQLSLGGLSLGVLYFF